MRLQNDLNYRIIGEFDIHNIAHELSTLSADVWEVNKSRQNRSIEHQYTKSIFINNVDTDWVGNGYPLEKYFVNEKLYEYTEAIISILENKFNGKIGKAIYINLPAKKQIRVHKDYGYYLTSVHRCHIPIITNENVNFHLNGETINMKAGICYEINNKNDHGVFNSGETDRVHLLIDIIPMSAFK